MAAMSACRRWIVANGRVGLITGLVLGIAACTVPRATVDPSGRLNILGPGPDFSPDRVSGEWIRVDPGRDGPRFATANADGIRSLAVVSGRQTGLLVRRTDAILMVAPFLSWAWSIAPHTGTEHPVRIIVGFYGGDPASGSWGSRPVAWLGSELPPYDRLLTVGWDASALRRGNLSPPREDPRAPRHYTVRGGEENAGVWRFETVDLAQVYRQAWPMDDPSAAKIMFVGIAAVGSDAPASANVSGIVLSR
jgi:hypothetical protein